MGTRRYHRLQFDAPEHWIDASTIVLLSPDGPPDHRPNVMIGRDEGEDAVAYGREQVAKLKRETKNYKSFATETIEVGGRPALFVEHSFKTPQNITVRQQQLYVRDDGDLIVILSLTHVDEDFERVRADFDKLRKSFSFA